MNIWKIICYCFLLLATEKGKIIIIFYSGLKFSLIMTSHSVKCKFKLLFFTLDSGKISLQLKYILNLASVTFFLKCSIKKFCACLVLRSFFAQIYCVYIFVFHQHGISQVKILYCSRVIKTSVHSDKMHVHRTLIFLLKFGSMECFSTIIISQKKNCSYYYLVRCFIL